MKNFLITFILASAFTSNASTIKSRSLDIGTGYNQDQLESMQREIETLTSKVEFLEKNLMSLKRLIEDKSIPNDNPPIETPMVSPNEHQIESTPKEVITEPEKHVSKGSEKQVYDAALSALKSGDYSFSIKKFDEFIENFSKSSLVPNAYFWIGESYFKQKQYEKSALNYLKSYKLASKGPKASDSLLKLAISLSELKKIPDACGILNKLDNEFHSRSEASVKKTISLRTQLKCK